MNRTMSPEQETRFSVFWQAYPRHRAKIDAQRAWRQINPSDADLFTILLGIRIYQESGEWKDPQFIPYPATFLRRRQWEDDLTPRGTEQPGSESERCLFKPGYVPRQLRTT